MKLILPDFCVERHVRLLEDLLDSLQITHLHTIKEILLQTTYPSPKIIKLLINAASLPKSLFTSNLAMLWSAVSWDPRRFQG